MLRMLPYEQIAERLAGFGMVTERLSGGTFPQRTFVSAAEQASALADVTQRGLDPSGLEGSGRYYADLSVSRPAADAAQRPLEDLLDVSALSVRP